MGKLQAFDRGSLQKCESVTTWDCSSNEVPLQAFWDLQACPKLRSLAAEGNPGAEGDFMVEVLQLVERLEVVNGEEVTDDHRQAAVDKAAEKKAAAEAAAEEG